VVDCKCENEEMRKRKQNTLMQYNYKRTQHAKAAVVDKAKAV